MKTLWICGPLFLLPIAAFSWISVALSGAGEPLSEARASPLNTPVEADARDLSEYVFLHETRNESIPLRIAARANACSGVVRGGSRLIFRSGRRTS